MLRTWTIEKELILPDALKYWEFRSRGETLLAELFFFWRFRYFVSILFFGVFLLFKNFLIGIGFILICFIFDYLILRSRAKRNFKVQISELRELVVGGFYESDIFREDAYEYNLEKRKIKENQYVSRE